MVIDYFAPDKGRYRSTDYPQDCVLGRLARQPLEIAGDKKKGPSTKVGPFLQFSAQEKASLQALALQTGFENRASVARELVFIKQTPELDRTRPG